MKKETKKTLWGILLLIAVGLFVVFKDVMTEYLGEVVKWVVASGTFIYIVHKLIDSFFEFRRDSFNAELQKQVNEHNAELDSSLKDYQSKIDASLKEVQFKHDLELSKKNLLATKRIDVLSDLYQKISLTLFLYREMTARVKFSNSSESFEEREVKEVNDSANAFNEFSKFFDLNRIYFSSKICEEIDKLRKTLFEILDKHSLTLKLQIKDPKLKAQERKEAYDMLTKDLPPILEIIEKEFREIIGVE